MFGSWAEAQGLVPHGHDAAYAGAMSGVRVAIETGVRNTGLYDVVVTLALECRHDPVILKRTSEVQSEHRVVRTACDLLAEQETMRSLRIDDAEVIIRWGRDVAIEQIEDAVRRIADAWRTLAPYR